jgi:hypothetical protein
MSSLNSNRNHLHTTTFISMELSIYWHGHPTLHSNLLSYLGESLTDLLAPSISMFIPLLLIIVRFYCAYARSPRERNEALLSNMLGWPAGRLMTRRCSRYAIWFNACWSRCHKWMGRVTDPADRKMHSVCLESVIGSEFACGVTKDIPLIFSQFTDRDRLVLSCCV